MDEAQMREQVAGMRFAVELRRQFEGLAAGDAATVHAPRNNWLLAAAVLAAVAVVALVVLVGLPALRDGHLTGPEPASAAQLMLEKIAHVRATASTLNGDIEFVSQRDYQNGAHRSRGSFVAAADGSLRLEVADLAGGSPRGAVHDVRTLVYDAARHRAMQLVAHPHGVASYSVARNAPPQYVAYWSESPFAYAASLQRLRAAVAPGDSKVRVVDGLSDERPVWIASWTTDVTDAAAHGAPAWYAQQMTVDKATGLVLHYRSASLGAQDHGYDELTLTRLRVDAPVPPGTFTLRAPHGAPRSTYDFGYQFGPLDLVSRGLGAAALAPTELPPGYALADAASKPRDLTVAGLLWPRSGPVGRVTRPRELALWYRRGFYVISVTVAPALRNDTFVPPQKLVAALRHRADGSLRVTTLTSGALAGATAYSWSGVQESGVLVVSGEVIVWVTGDATAGELLRLANSLSPAGG